MANIKTKSIDELFNGILSLNDLKECYLFFSDLCTISELQDMAKRFEAAKLLEQGENYAAISTKLGISTATISRISTCLKYGDGGYKTVIDRLK